MSALVLSSNEETFEGVEIVLEVLQGIFVLNPIPSKMRSYSPLSDELLNNASNIAGVLAALPDKKKTEIEATLTDYVAHLPERDIQKIWAEAVGRLNADAMLYCEESWGIEDVDDGLYPSHIKLLLKMLREVGAKRNIDILITTHNPALLNALDPEMIPFITVAHRNTQTGASELTLLEDLNNLPQVLALGPLGNAATSGVIEKSLAANK